MKKSHTVDETGFDYMANSGIEERDRDLVGILLAFIFMAMAVLFQSLGML